MNLGKARTSFYTQYLGQELIVPEYPKEHWYPFDRNERGLFLAGVLDNTIIVSRIAEHVKDTFKQTCLLLRTVNQLTDDECKQIGRAVGMNYLTAIERNEECIFITNDNYFIGLYYTGVVVMQKGTGLSVTPFWNYIDAIYQLLKAFGILLPFTYIDETGKLVTLSPEEIIALGWAKTINHPE